MRMGIYRAMLILQLAGLGCNAQPRQPSNATASSIVIAVGNTPSSVEIADLNADGKADIVVADADDNAVTVLLGDGKGKFAEAKGSPFAAGNSPNDICVADLNGDGKPDLAIANHEAKYITVLLGDGQGGFTPAHGSPVPVLSTPHTHGVAVGDFNADGKLDIVTDSWAENRVTVVFGDGHGAFSSPGVQFGVGKRPYERLRVADINGDGHPDIITTNLDGDNITVLLGDGKGAFTKAPGSPFPAGKTPFGVAIADLNGDGKLDLAVVNFSGHPERAENDGVTILLGDGKGGFKIMAGSPFTTGHSPVSVGIGDVNGDGVPDIVTADLASNSVTVLVGGKGTFTRAATIVVGNKPSGIAVADLNGDGKADIVVTNSWDNDISVLLSK